jgi:hypothetical protein
LTDIQFPSGGIIIDGNTYKFTGVVDPLPGDVTGSQGFVSGYSEYDVVWQTVNVTDLSCGTHSITTTSTSDVESSWPFDNHYPYRAFIDCAPPEIILKDVVIVLWPPNHKYHTVTIGDLVESVWDACDADVSVADVVITSVSSDEPEDEVGNGDGNTTDDIVIVDAQTVDLRSERQGNGNGRVYTINFEVTDVSGNTATGSAQVSVPHDNNVPAVDGPGPGYTVVP